jgi:hypothetical protein
MKVIDIYLQYFSAECEFAGTLRKGAAVRLTAESDAGTIRYSVSVSFFPHADAGDFGISGDAFAERELYSGKGRRSKKREQTYLAALREHADAAAQSLGGVIHWDAPLIEARYA